MFSFRHAALRSVTRKKQGNFTVRQEPDKDQDQQQLNLLSMSFYGSKLLTGGNVLQLCWIQVFSCFKGEIVTGRSNPHV